MNNVRGLFGWCFLGLALGGCANTSVSMNSPEAQIASHPYVQVSKPLALSDLEFNENLFLNAPSPPELTDLLALSPAVKNDFYNYFNKPEMANYTAIERVASYLGLLVDGFTYSENTYTAQQTVDNRGGNCLSLTLLTTAIANLADVKVSYDLLDDQLNFSLEQGVFLTADHLRAVLVESFSGSNAVTGRRLKKRITIDYFDIDGLTYAEKISVNYQLSLYYSNRAAELLVEGASADAFAHGLRALKVSPDNSSAINTLAVLHRRMGEEDVAELAYRVAIDTRARYAPLVYRNYIALLEQQGRYDDARMAIAEYQKIQKQHPAQWVRDGRRAHQKGDYKLAIEYYEKALEIAPNLHEVYLLSVHSSMAAGDIGLALTQLKSALDLELTSTEANIYKGKLGKLKRTYSR